MERQRSLLKRRIKAMKDIAACNPPTYLTKSSKFSLFIFLITLKTSLLAFERAQRGVRKRSRERESSRDQEREVKRERSRDQERVRTFGLMISVEKDCELLEDP